MTAAATSDEVPFSRIIDENDNDKSNNSNRSSNSRSGMLTKKDSSSAAIGRVGWVGHFIILSLPLVAMSCTLSFLILLLRFDKQQNDQYQNDNENENNYSYENLKDSSMNEVKSYYKSVQEQTLSAIMAEYESYWQLIVLSSLAALFTSMVTIGRNIQIFVSQNRLMLENPCANNNNNKSSSSCCTKSCTSKVINIIATLLNIASYIGWIIAVLYKAGEDDLLHSIGAYLFFVGTAVYAVLHSYLLWTQQQYNIVIKLLFTLLATLIATSSIIFAYSRLDENTADKYGTMGLDLPVFEWVAIITTALNIGFMTILFYVDPVDDEIRDFLVFFCCIDRCCKNQRC